MNQKILILECAGLDMAAVGASSALASGCGLGFRELKTVFPAVTCTAQATMRTALEPSRHGVVANGRFDRRSCKVDFWNQSAGLVGGERIWREARRRGCKVGVLFHQQSLGDETEYCLSPAPIHKHHGGMIMACHTQPPSLEAEMKAAAGGRFKLYRYWGPLASSDASWWCARSTAYLMESHGPQVLFSYLPHLDYCLQREGPRGASLPREADTLAECLSLLLKVASERGYEVVVWGDYAITEAVQPVYPNRLLLEAGLFQPREIGGMLYPNLYDSRAFAMVDHQIAHVFVKHPEDVSAVRQVLEGRPGIESVRTPSQAGLEHSECGELVLTASPGAWFAYGWWEESRQAPDYATHVDIHNKIGFDPCELFWKFPMVSTCQDARRVRGTHGRDDTPAVFAVTAGLADALGASSSQLELSRSLKNVLDAMRP